MKPTLLVLAAGMGSRYGGVKQIDSVGQNGECLLDFAAYDARKAGFGKVVYIIRKDIEKDFRERLFDRVARNMDAEYVFQSHESLLTEEQIKLSATRTKPWGTAHAVLCAEKQIHEPFAVINSDDYYGRSAFETLGKHLAALNNDSTEHAMVGYVLDRTMSRNGSVSRGVCTVKDGRLESIVENLKIYFEGDKVISEIDDKKIQLTGKETVSMNLFGFSPKAFEQFNEYWKNFIKENVTAEKKEALLPVVASDIIRTGHGSLKVYTSEESWFGMTYPEDREVVKSEIAKKIASGYYPEKLWEK
ncbi:MAG: sugar phosphate nucleotidyltransferase [Treponema sp.]|nr:sugar phosphate nucleotidyltransferase [Treponema sp.]